MSFSDFMNPNEQGKKVIAQADFFVIVPSKTHPETLVSGFKLRDMKKPFGIMQEGPNNLWQDWPPNYQIIYLAILKELATVVFCHNELDTYFFRGLTNKPVMVFPTTHHVKRMKELILPVKGKDENVFLGGTLCRWYNGTVSYLVGNVPGIKTIGVPSMGRLHSNEKEIMEKADSRIMYFPYMTWEEYLKVLTEFKYGIHLMPNSAAGSFSLNCAILGIPCIGNIKEDVQRICFPETSINVEDVQKAKELFARLKEDEEFYNRVRETALKNVDLFDIDNCRERFTTKLITVLRGKQ
jgi:hypothetical protein